MGLADMDNCKWPNTFLKGLIKSLLLPDNVRKLDNGIRGLGLVNERDLGRSNSLDDDDVAGSTREESAEGGDNQDNDDL